MLHRLGDPEATLTHATTATVAIVLDVLRIAP
jgi:hypothetical protein